MRRSLNYEILPIPSVKMKLTKEPGITHPFFSNGVLLLPYGFRKKKGKINSIARQLASSPRVITVLLCNSHNDGIFNVILEQYYFHRTHYGWEPIYESSPVLERAFEIAQAFAALGSD